MEPVSMESDTTEQVSADTLSFARKWVWKFFNFLDEIIVLWWFFLAINEMGCWLCHQLCFFILMISGFTVLGCCSYQLEALESALKQNTIVFLETGSGKTLIAIMLLRSYAYLLRKPSPFIAVFLVPKVVLVPQVCPDICLWIPFQWNSVFFQMPLFLVIKTLKCLI